MATRDVVRVELIEQEPEFKILVSWGYSGELEAVFDIARDRDLTTEIKKMVREYRALPPDAEVVIANEDTVEQIELNSTPPRRTRPQHACLAPVKKQKSEPSP